MIEFERGLIIGMTTMVVSFVGGILCGLIYLIIK